MNIVDCFVPLLHDSLALPFATLSIVSASAAWVNGVHVTNPAVVGCAWMSREKVVSCWQQDH